MTRDEQLTALKCEHDIVFALWMNTKVGTRQYYALQAQLARIIQKKCELLAQR